MQSKEEVSFSGTWHEKLFPPRLRFRHNSNISFKILEKIFLVLFKSWAFKAFVYENFPTTSISASKTSFYSILWVCWCRSETICLSRMQKTEVILIIPLILWIWSEPPSQNRDPLGYYFYLIQREKKNHCPLLKDILLEWVWGNVGASSMLETQSLNNFFKPTLRCISTPKSHPLLIMSLNYGWAVSNHNCWIFSDYKTV